MMRGLIVRMAIAGLPVAVSAQTAVPVAAVPAQPRVPAQDAAAPKGHALEGVVRDAKGEPVVGALIDARLVAQGAVAPANFEGAPAKSMHSDKDGHWALQDLAPGNWLVTAMANADPAAAQLGDADLIRLARLGANARTPAGLALARVLRHIAAEPAATTESVDLALALGPVPERALFGRITGAFHPDTCGYEVHVNCGNSMPGGGNVVITGSGSGTTTVTTTVSGKTLVTEMSVESNLMFTQVPDRDGRFDFGALQVSDASQISVVGIPLTDGGDSLGGTVFPMPLIAFFNWKAGIEIPLTAMRTITLKATTADGKPVTVADDVMVSFDTWSAVGEQGWGEKAPSTHQSLAEGSYLAQVRMGELASAIVPLTVEATGGATEVSFVLQPCPPFTVHFVDAKGAPLPKAWTSLGIEARRDLGARRAVGRVDDGGQLKVEGVPPGTYDVMFRIQGRQPFTRTLELKPGDAPVVVSMP
jgi:hypothetical protein